ncbi:hypothetical protein [uncultured Flavobacterium sp.]|uniref:hypothetical protein n=1 Tax=uncultured Flavobacterium sp. TaxID=165435 RepID=UPI0030EB8FB3|tara:strand:+ start:275253 stop:276503 length:1251 start_codon:yes stop_codon:yes gene_type:complete
MIKKLFLALTFLATVVVSAQEGTSSPYSFYGLGDIKFKGTHDARAMGGLGIAYDSIHLNLLNPATYSRLKITNFTIGGTTTYNNLSSEQGKETAQRTAIDYLAVGLPLGKFGAVFGLMPFSSVGYKIQNQTSDGDLRSTRYTGEGGINKFFAGTAYNISDNLSVGLDIQYNFGTIETESAIFLPNVILGSRERNKSNIRGLSTNFALLYTKSLANKLTLNTSFGYAPEAKLNSENSRNIATISYTSTGVEFVNDNDDLEVRDTKLVIPAKYTLGAGIGLPKKWFVGLEYIYQENSNLGNRFDDINNATFENSQKIILGGNFIPKYNSFSSYWSRVNYRAGFRYENTGLIINSKQINDYGINFGLGLPVGGRFSNINLGFEYGKKGTIYNNLIEENYFNISVGLSLNDLWFEKRKYD